MTFWKKTDRVTKADILNAVLFVRETPAPAKKDLRGRIPSWAITVFFTRGSYSVAKKFLAEFTGTPALNAFIRKETYRNYLCDDPAFSITLIDQFGLYNAETMKDLASQLGRGLTMIDRVYMFYVSEPFGLTPGTADKDR